MQQSARMVFSFAIGFSTVGRCRLSSPTDCQPGPDTSIDQYCAARLHDPHNTGGDLAIDHQDPIHENTRTVKGSRLLAGAGRTCQSGRSNDKRLRLLYGCVHPYIVSCYYVGKTIAPSVDALCVCHVYLCMALAHYCSGLPVTVDLRIIGN